MRKGQVFIFLVGGALVLIMSFSITLWLTEPEVPPADKVKIFATSTISDEATLAAAARAAGLKNSSYVRGNIEALRRVDATHVNISGWVTETSTFISKGAPINVLAFSGGRNILNVETQGERSDVTATLNLTDEAAKNVMFAGQLVCSPLQKIIIAGATLSGTYTLLGTVSCP